MAAELVVAVVLIFVALQSRAVRVLLLAVATSKLKRAESLDHNSVSAARPSMLEKGVRVHDENDKCCSKWFFGRGEKRDYY